MVAKIKETNTKPEPSILMDGTATPYLAIFSEEGMPVMNKLTGIPLGAYISQFQYKFDEEHENECIINFDTGNPDVVDQEDLQTGKTIWLQWGYIYPDGTSICNEPKAIKVKDFNCTFNDSGTHVALKCVDGTGDIRQELPLKADGSKEELMSTFLDNGCELDIGVIIEKFE